MNVPSPTQEPIETTPAMSRRRFLKRAGVVGAAIPIATGLVISACYDDPTGGPVEPGVDPQNQKPGTPAATPPPADRVTEIDNEHKDAVTEFLQNQKAPLTKGKGMQELAPRTEDGVKIFELTIDEVDWEVEPGKTEKARGYNNQIPGPTLRATVGERVRINVKNNLAESTAVHWHGLLVPNAMDGVPFLTQEPIKPGATYTYEFTIRNARSHMYHSHHNSADQVNRGLLGAFIVLPANRAEYAQYDREFILIMNDTLLGFTLNGKSFPATDALVAQKGERVLIRWMNEGMMYHPMHLHGMAMEVFERDGYPVSPPFKCDTIDVPPGNRFDCIIQADEPGLWAFHCHVLSHAEHEGGFFGLVTALAVEDATFKVADLLAKV